MSKSITAYKTISEVVEIVGLKSKTSQSLPTHTIRFWETKFKQIKPKILNGNRRYYDEKSIEIIKKIHFLLKVKGMTSHHITLHYSLPAGSCISSGRCSSSHVSPSTLPV